MKNKRIALIGLGAIGAPLAHKLYDKYEDDFIVLADKKHAQKLNREALYINGSLFLPQIISDRPENDRPIEYVFVCVKNYSIISVCEFLKTVLTRESVIIPLQNGVYSFEYITEKFPDNVVLEAFVQGPNTVVTGNSFVYQNIGEYHIGTETEYFRSYVEEVSEILVSSGINCLVHKDIRHEIWKKLMLNVAGNALTAITGLDYKMMKYSPEAQKICKAVMQEFAAVADTEGIHISQADMADVLQYFITYDKSKHTSMLEDVLNKRQTENEYIDGYIKVLAEQRGIAVPCIEMLYGLVKIKEDVYTGKLGT